MFFIGFFFGMVLFYSAYKIRFKSLRDQLAAITKKNTDALSAYTHEIEKKHIDQQQQLQEHRTKFETEKAAFYEKKSFFLKEEEEFIKKKELLANREKQIRHIEQQLQHQATMLSNMTLDEAKDYLLHHVEQTIANQIELKKKTQIKIFETESSIQSREILLTAIERTSQKVTKELFITCVSIPDLTVIGILIGKEGKNIHFLEHILHVNIAIEENSILISSHDPFLRYIAQKTLSSLIQGKKITPSTITSTVTYIQEHIEQSMIEDGSAILATIDPRNTYPEPICTAVGKMRIRSTCHQNLLSHSLHVSQLMEHIAAETQLDRHIAKKIGFFHDIGKVIPFSYGASHAIAGSLFLKEFSFDSKITDAILAHHGEGPLLTPEAKLLPICDRLSSSLKGNRHEEEPSFMEVVRQCETAARKSPHVRSAWAHYAGSHLELLVTFDKNTSDRPLLLQEELSTLPLYIPVLITTL